MALLQDNRELVEFVRDFIRNVAAKNVKNWKKETTDLRKSHIKAVLQTAKNIFKGEDRLVQVDSPCNVFGSLLGSLSDVMKIDKTFWTPIDVSSPSFLFLGNYIGVGDYSIEVFLYHESETT